MSRATARIRGDKVKVSAVATIVPSSKAPYQFETECRRGRVFVNPLQAEVEDIVDFLRSREDDRHLVTAAAKNG